MFNLDVASDRAIVHAILNSTPAWVDIEIAGMEFAFTRSREGCGEYRFKSAFAWDDDWEFYKEYIQECIIKEVNSSLKANAKRYWRPFPYHKNPISHFKMSLNPKAVYFGVELEHKGDRNLSILSSKIEKYAIVKYDSSVDLELVTIPLTWKECPAAIEYLREWITQSQGDEVTGMHVHISRSPFTSEAVERFITLWGEMVKDSRWYGVFGRRPNDYCKYVPTERVLSEGAKYAHVGASHPDTLEVRVFGHTNDPTLILRRIKLVDLTYKYCMRVHKFDYDHFTKWYRSIVK